MLLLMVWTVRKNPHVWPPPIAAWERVDHKQGHIVQSRRRSAGVQTTGSIIAKAEETGVGVREQPPESTTSEWLCELLLIIIIIMGPRRRIIAHYLPRLHVCCFVVGFY